MAKEKFELGKIREVELQLLIRERGAPTTKEIKDHFKTNSAEVRRVCGKLMTKNQIFPMPWKQGNFAKLYWMEVTGEKGQPRPIEVRERAKEHREKLERKRSKS